MRLSITKNVEIISCKHNLLMYLNLESLSLFYHLFMKNSNYGKCIIHKGGGGVPGIYTSGASTCVLYTLSSIALKTCFYSFSLYYTLN